MSEQLEKITFAAVKDLSGHIMIGRCHADCIYKLVTLGLEFGSNSASQGFVTNIQGRFVSRQEAFKIAKAANQLPEDMENKSDILFSEDLWSPFYKAVNRYDEIKGYVRIEE